MVDEAVTFGKEVAPRQYELNLGRTIGTTSLGSPANGIRVIVRDGNVQTAFPVLISP